MPKNEVRIASSSSDQGFECDFWSSLAFVAVGEIEYSLGVFRSLVGEDLERLRGAGPVVSVHGQQSQIEVSARQGGVDANRLFERFSREFRILGAYFDQSQSVPAGRSKRVDREATFQVTARGIEVAGSESVPGFYLEGVGAVADRASGSVHPGYREKHQEEKGEAWDSVSRTSLRRAPSGQQGAQGENEEGGGSGHIEKFQEQGGAQAGDTASQPLRRCAPAGASKNAEKENQTQEAARNSDLREYEKRQVVGILDPGRSVGKRTQPRK
jgi:hypothetical protein